ncbi:MAG: hypothetical protein ACRCSX_07990 [Allorhizobium sp.]
MALEWMDEAPQEPEVVAPVEQVEEPAIEAQPEPEAPVRDEAGRFAPKAQTQVPVSALEAERSRRQAVEAQLADYQRQQQTPDPEYDPSGYTDHQVQTIQQQLQAQLFQQSLTFSRRLAEQVHTPEAVAQAHEWGMARCDADPLFNQRVSTSPDPYEFVVSEWKRDQVLSRLQGNDLDQFLQWKAQQANPLGAPQPQHIPQQPVAPPRSLASAPAAGTARPGAPPTYQGAAFDTVFRN